MTLGFVLPGASIRTGPRPALQLCPPVLVGTLLVSHTHIFALAFSSARCQGLPAKHLPVAMAAEREGSRTSERANNGDSSLEPDVAHLQP